MNGNKINRRHLTEAKPGHLSKGELNLVQSERTRRSLRRAAEVQHTMATLKPVLLNWVAPSKG